MQGGLRIRADKPTVLAGDSTPLRATTMAAQGSRRATDVTWRTLDGGDLVKGVVDSEPVTQFTATEAGSYRLVAVSPSLGSTDTMLVTMASASVTSTITSLVMKPARATLLPNDTLRFVVWGRTAAGDSVPAPVTLYPDHGYVRGMDYFCPIEGTFQVRAVLDGSSITASAYVTVSKSATAGTGSTSSSDVVRIVMSPHRDTIAPGDTLTFAVHGVSSSGASVAVTAQLLPDRGYVRDLKWIMPLEGTYRIRAVQSGGTLADTAFITVKEGATSSTGDSGTDIPDGSEPVVSDPSNITSPPPSGSVAEMPRTFLDSRYVAPTGKVINVPAGGNLQAAINDAARGDVIQLAAGATYVGNFVLPPKAGSGWVTIRTAATLPAEGTRVTPSTASGFAKLVTPNSMPAIRTALSGSVSQYRLMGLEFKSQASMSFAIVYLGDFNQQATSISELPQSIVLDRVYIHGVGDQNIQRCLVLNSRSTAVVDSWLSDCHYDHVESQAIISWNSPGPFKIVNNHLEGATENVMFGGADPGFVGMVPSDIEIRRNHFFKPLAWGSTTRWAVKNMLEVKNGQRMLIEGNIFENNWAQAQTGFAIVLKSQNQSGGCNWCVTQDVTWRYNYIRNSPGGFNLAATQALSGGTAVAARRIDIQHTVFDRVGLDSQTGAKIIFQLLDNVSDITIAHNTAMTQDKIMLFDGTPASTPNLVFRDNLMARGRHGVYGSGYAEGTTALNHYARGGVFTHNALIAAPSTMYPTGNYFPTTATVAGLLNYLSDDFLLSSLSPLLRSATDGSMVGADVTTLNQKTAGVD